MSAAGGSGAAKAEDSIQQCLTRYACDINYASLPAQVIDAAKLRVIDTLGALIAGFFAESSRIARTIAAASPMQDGATVIGTRMRTTPDMAAFVNSTAARYCELTDSSPLQKPGGVGGHPSDVVTPLLAVAEYAQTDGRDLITGIVLAYEVYLRFGDLFHNKGFDHTNFCCLAVALAAGKMLALSPDQLAQAVSMAVVPNNSLRVSRTGHLSMWKVTATGQAARAGIFAAQLARAGMQGPHLPFEGKAGWCEHIALERFSLGGMGGEPGSTFKMFETGMKMRPCVASGIQCVLAAEKVAPLQDPGGVQGITVEVSRHALSVLGEGEHHWHPESKETADHSGPFLVAATLLDGTLTLRSFNNTEFSRPALHALMQKIKIVENAEFTRAHNASPSHNQVRVIVETVRGERMIGIAGSEADSLTTPKTAAQIAAKFRGLSEDFLGARRVDVILDRLQQLEKLDNVVSIPPDFVLA